MFCNSSPSVTRVTEQVKCMGEDRRGFWILMGKPEGNNRLEYLSIDKRIILERILNTYNEIEGIGCILLRIGFKQIIPVVYSQY